MEPVREITPSLEEFRTEAVKRKSVEFEEALIKTGFGKYNVFLILVCGLLLFASNVEAYGIGFVVPAAECELNLDSYTKGVLTSSNFIGVISSCAIWGYVSDIMGRRKLMMLNLVLAFIAGAMAAVTPSFWGFVVLRFINGLCMSCPMAVTFVYFGEFLCANTRPKSLPWTMSFVALALIFLPCLGWFFLQRTFTLRFLGLTLNNWRTFMLVDSTPSIIVALALTRFPESPRYLYYTGRTKEALQVLKEMYSCNTGNPEDSFPVESLSTKILLENSSQKKNVWQHITSQILPLFKPPLLTYTLAGSFMLAGTFALSSGLFFWYPDIVSQVSNSGKISVTICEALSANGMKEEAVHCSNIVDDRVFILNIIIGVSYLVAFIAWGVVVKAIGTRKFFMICMIIGSISMFLICFLSEKIMIDIFFITGLTLPGISVSVINAWIVEIFPTNIGAMALCTSLTAGRLGSVISSSVAGIMLDWNCTATFILYGCSQIVCMVLSLLLPQNR